MLYNQMIDTAIDNGHATPKMVHVYKSGPKAARNAGRDGDMGRAAQMNACAGGGKQSCRSIIAAHLADYDQNDYRDPGSVGSE